MDEGALNIEIAAPEREALKFEADEVVLPGEAGVFTVQPGHTAVLAHLAPGVLTIRAAAGQERIFAVNGGFTEVLDNRVSVLTETVESSAEIDLERAQTARDRAEERLRQRDSDVDLARAEAALRRALARINAYRAAQKES